MAHLTLSVFASPRLRPKRRVGCSDRDSASSLWRGGERSRWASFSGLPECSECLIRSLPLVVKQCCPLGGDCWLEVCNACCKPVWVLPPSLARGVHGRVVNGDTDEVSSFFSACCGAVPVGLFNAVGHAFALVCYLSCIDAWVFL